MNNLHWLKRIDFIEGKIVKCIKFTEENRSKIMDYLITIGVEIFDKNSDYISFYSYLNRGCVLWKGDYLIAKQNGKLDSCMSNLFEDLYYINKEVDNESI